MNARTPRPGDAPAPDEEWADAYAAGYGEGLREALREMLSHASRGHTAQELRLLIESRLARLRDDIDLKRRSLLAPPRRAAYTPFFRTAAPPEPAPPAISGVVRANSYVVFEARPDRALRLLAAAASEFPRVLVVSFHPPEVPGLPPERATVLPVAVGGVAGPAGDAGLSPEAIGGRIREATEADGGALVYVDALEVLATGGAVDAMVKFVQWTAHQVATTRSVLIASVGPSSFDERVKSLLQRSFNTVL